MRIHSSNDVTALDVVSYYYRRPSPELLVDALLDVVDGQRAHESAESGSSTQEDRPDRTRLRRLEPILYLLVYVFRDLRDGLPEWLDRLELMLTAVPNEPRSSSHPDPHIDLLIERALRLADTESAHRILSKRLGPGVQFPRSLDDEGSEDIPPDPRAVDRLWARFFATGERRCIDQIARLLPTWHEYALRVQRDGIDPNEAPFLGAARYAARTLTANAYQHERVRKICEQLTLADLPSAEREELYRIVHSVDARIERDGPYKREVATIAYLESRPEGTFRKAFDKVTDLPPAIGQPADDDKIEALRAVLEGPGWEADIAKRYPHPKDADRDIRLLTNRLNRATDSFEDRAIVVSALGLLCWSFDFPRVGLSVIDREFDVSAWTRLADASPLYAIHLSLIRGLLADLVAKTGLVTGDEDYGRANTVSERLYGQQPEIGFQPRLRALEAIAQRDHRYASYRDLIAFGDAHFARFATPELPERLALFQAHAALASSETDLNDGESLGSSETFEPHRQALARLESLGSETNLRHVDVQVLLHLSLANRMVKSEQLESSMDHYDRGLSLLNDLLEGKQSIEGRALDDGDRARWHRRFAEFSIYRAVTLSRLRDPKAAQFAQESMLRLRIAARGPGGSTLEPFVDWAYAALQSHLGES